MHWSVERYTVSTRENNRVTHFSECEERPLWQNKQDVHELVEMGGPLPPLYSTCVDVCSCIKPLYFPNMKYVLVISMHLCMHMNIFGVDF